MEVNNIKINSQEMDILASWYKSSRIYAKLKRYREKNSQFTLDMLNKTFQYSPHKLSLKGGG